DQDVLGAEITTLDRGLLERLLGSRCGISGDSTHPVWFLRMDGERSSLLLHATSAYEPGVRARAATCVARRPGTPGHSGPPEGTCRCARTARRRPQWRACCRRVNPR